MECGNKGPDDYARAHIRRVSNEELTNYLNHVDSADSTVAATRKLLAREQNKRAVRLLFDLPPW